MKYRAAGRCYMLLTAIIVASELCMSSTYITSAILSTTEALCIPLPRITNHGVRNQVVALSAAAASQAKLFGEHGDIPSSLPGRGAESSGD